MKVIVAIKRVIDYRVNIKVKTDNSGVDVNNVKMSIDPFCEIALEEAVRLKEQGIASEVIVVAIGSAKVQEQLRSALALGADSAILVECEQELTSLMVAKLLHAIVREEKPGLMLLGKQAIDSDNNQTGQMLAALLNCAQGTFASRVSIEADKSSLVVTRETDKGLQTLSLTLPAVITTDLRLNQPRYATLPNIMQARKKHLKTVSPEALGVVVRSTLQTLSVVPPHVRSAGVKVHSVTELVDKLKTEARVI
ncbi:MAG: electron transfer flavoprotein subunit beta/FixA family protein [Enterobacteriaceae bacterium]